MVVDHAPLLGHEEALQAVRRMRLQECLPHALLLTGPDGVGKTTFALTVAADLACDDLQSDGGHCGVCRGCTLALAGSHPDILRIAPPKEETTIGQMRELRYVANLAPNLSSRRVIVIEKAETLNDQAANAILKVLEDAPDHLLLMALAPSCQSVLPTIESRSIEIPLKPVERIRLADFLRLQGVESGEADTLSAYSGGVPGRAISLSKNPELVALLARVGAWVDKLSESPLGLALKLAEELGDIADLAKKYIRIDDVSEDPAAVSDRQAIGWTLDALMAAFQSSFDHSQPKWEPEQTAKMAGEVNRTRRLILSYAAADLQLERLVIRLLQS